MDSSLSAESLRVPDPLASNPECVKVKDWRHKLQKAFLGESMPAESASCGFVEEKKVEKNLTVSIGNAALERSIRVYRDLRLYDNRSASVLQDWQGCVLSHILASWYYSTEKKLTGVYYSHEEDYGSHHYSPERQV